MSFKCGLCSTQTKPREKATRVVLEMREAIYPFRENANTFWRSEKIDDMFVRGKKDKSSDPGGVGFEIAKEALICQHCASFIPPTEEEETVRIHEIQDIHYSNTATM